jgi:hypothetical protein
VVVPSLLRQIGILAESFYFLRNIVVQFAGDLRFLIGPLERWRPEVPAAVEARRPFAPHAGEAM